MAPDRPTVAISWNSRRRTLAGWCLSHAAVNAGIDIGWMVRKKKRDPDDHEDSGETSGDNSWCTQGRNNDRTCVHDRGSDCAPNA